MEIVNTTCIYSTSIVSSCHCCMAEPLFSPAVIFPVCVARTFRVQCPSNDHRNTVIMNGNSALLVSVLRVYIPSNDTSCGSKMFCICISWISKFVPAYSLPSEVYPHHNP